MKNFPMTVLAAAAVLSMDAAVKSAADYDVGDYVQDGLVAHYDGIRNAGADLPHDPEAAKWLDLANAGVYASRENISSKSSDKLGAWTGNSFRFEGNSCMVMSTPIALGADFTIQAILDLDLDSERAVAEGRTYPTIFSRSTDDTLLITMNRSWATPIAKTNVFWKTDRYSTTGNSTGRPTVDPFHGKYINAAFDSTLDRNYLSQTASFTKSGAYVSQANKADQSVEEMAYSWGGRAGTVTSGMVGDYYALRIYSRKLSDEELAWNMAVDEVRFRGGAIPRTNVVVEASVYAGVGGAEAAGVYEVVGSHTFTAPDITVGGVLYRAAGYTVETWNGNFWSSAGRFEGGAYTYTAGDDSPIVRLTWLWKPCGIRAMSDYDACDYVQGALVAQYDGIRNAGAENAHNPAATVWLDLKAADNYMTFNGTTDVAAATGEWTGGNAYKFNGFSYARMANPINLGSNITVQLAVDIDNAAQKQGYNTLFDQWMRTPLYFAAEKDGGAFANMYSDDSQSRHLQWKDNGQTGSGASVGRAQLYGWNYHYITAITTDERAYLFESDDYCADETPVGAPKSFVRTKWGEFKDYRWTVGGAHYDDPDEINKRLSIGKYHSVRFYNRPLTSEELIWNRKVDEIRFRGAVSTNVIVVSSKPDAQGVQPDGIYEVLGMGEFTAVAVKALKNGRAVTYVPAGYTIERLSGGEWSAPEAYGSAAYTYNVAEEGGQIVRLTWKWRTEGLGTVIIFR